MSSRPVDDDNDDDDDVHWLIWLEVLLRIGAEFGPCRRPFAYQQQRWLFMANTQQPHESDSLL